MSILKNHTFFDQVTVATVGTEMMVPGVVSPLASVTVAFSGSASARTIAFQGKGEVGGYTAIVAKNLATGISASQTTGVTPEIWQIPLMGLDYIRCNLLSMASGSMTGIGKVVV